MQVRGPGETSRERNAPIQQGLIVANALTALTHYRDLGFEVYMDGDEARVRIGKVLLRLQPGEPPGRRAEGAPDVTVVVDRPYRLIRQICERPGAHVLPRGIFGFEDHDGNVVAVRPTRGVRPAVKRLLWPPSLDRRWTGWRARLSSREEAPWLRAFQDFYRRLSEKRNVFYMFLPCGRLHWAAKSLSLVPANVNLVLIGSALSDHEREWVRRSVNRPFFHIDLRVDDVTALEFLFATNEYSFGWLDPECMVFNKALFEELSRIDDRHCVNSVWWQDVGLGFRVANASFQFVNVAAIRALRAAGLPASPNYYCVPPRPRQNRHVPGRRCYAEVVTPALRRLLQKAVLTQEPQRRSADGPAHGLLGPTHMFQAMARTLGFDHRTVRRLERDGPSGVDDPSDEIFHAGQLSSADHRRSTASPSDVPRGVVAEHIGLIGAQRLPPSYRERQQSVFAILAQFGLTPDAATDAARRFLVDEYRLPHPAVETMLRPSFCDV